MPAPQSFGGARLRFWTLQILLAKPAELRQASAAHAEKTREEF